MTTEASAQGAEGAADRAALSSQDDRDWETEARDLGWVPEEEFKGSKKPERFKTAQEFVEDIPPYVKKLLERQEAKLGDRLARIEKVNAKTIDVLNKQHKQELAALRAERQEAVKAGDGEAVERISDQIEKVKDSAADKEEVEDQNAAFKKRNAWYGEDEDLTAEAIRISKSLVEAYAVKNGGKQMPVDEMFDKVERKIKQTPEYKAKFGTGTTAANGHAAVDGGGENGGGGKANPLFSKLPPEAKTQASKDVKAGIYKNVEAWAEVYFS